MISPEDFAQLQANAQRGIAGIHGQIPTPAPRKRRAKYRNEWVQIDGYWFHSKGEGERYRILKVEEGAGRITDFVWDKTLLNYSITHNGIYICTYQLDFLYFSVEAQRRIAEDWKGYKTPEYLIKRRLMLAINHIYVSESGYGQ